MCYSFSFPFLSFLFFSLLFFSFPFLFLLRFNSLLFIQGGENSFVGHGKIRRDVRIMSGDFGYAGIQYPFVTPSYFSFFCCELSALDRATVTLASRPCLATNA